jgi:Spy/CpxP family protein refolding chaperone
MKTFKVLLALMVVFVAGMTVGVVGTRVVTRAVIRRAITHPDVVRIRIEHQLTRKLDLDSAQRAQVGEILKDTQKQIRKLRLQVQPQFLLILTNSHDRISAVLTPEQREKFDELIRKGPLM